MEAGSRPPNRLLQHLPAAEFQALCPHLETVELAKSAVLTEAGAPVPEVYLPHNGVVSMMVSLSEGQTVEVAMVGRDGLVGASAALGDGPALTDAIVVVPGTASVLKAEDLRAAADRSSRLRKLLTRHDQALFVQAQQSAACNASHSVEARLSRLLLRARDLCDSEGLPLTQEFLAQMIGARRNAVSIVAHAFQLAGLVSYSRGHIEIRDIDGLRKTSCECYAAVQLQCERLLNVPG
jgi:CRP-like cAMP-binding protein